MTLKVYGNLFTLFLSFRLIYFIKTLAHQNMECTVGCKDRNQLETLLESLKSNVNTN